MNINKPYNKTIINDLNNIFNNYDFSKIDAEDYKELILRCAMIIAFCDDGEPSKTAGAPLLNVLEKNKLNHVVAIVIRYFGGVKLGAGGLVRAYTKSVTECLKLTEIIKTSTGYLVEISFDHSDIKQVDFLLKDVEVNKTYDDNVTYTFCIQKNDFDLISDKLKNYIISMKIIEDIYV